jgi:hypothetical protein
MTSTVREASQWIGKPNSVRRRSRPHGRGLRRDDHSSSPGISAGIQRPTRKLGWTTRAACAARSPIWPCSVRGFACRLCCQRRGALLPHLFTIAAGSRPPVSCVFSVPLVRRVAPPGCYPAHCPDGVRTFLSRRRFPVPTTPCGTAGSRPHAGSGRLIHCDTPVYTLPDFAESRGRERARPLRCLAVIGRGRGPFVARPR